MTLNQNETPRNGGKARRLGWTLVSRSFRNRGFTLTELLVVITIIGILAGLAIPAIISAIEAANRTAILVEMQQIGQAVDAFKADYTAYPPNSMFDSNYNQAANDIIKMFRQAFPRHREPEQLLSRLAGLGTDLQGTNGVNGMNGAEAVVFWLGGFSADAQYPISGPGGPSFNINELEDLEGREKRYPFELTRLGPRDGSGNFSGRFLQYDAPNANGVVRQINLWTYTPSKSTQPIVYFDTSRHRAQVQVTNTEFANNYDPAFNTGGDPAFNTGGDLYALKRLNETNPNRVEFVNQGKFQVLHSGLDNNWGSMSLFSLDLAASPVAENVIKFPEGPFIGDLSDNLLHTNNGGLASLQE